MTQRFNGFKGAAKPLDIIDVPMLAHRINVSEDHFQAFINVESRARGFEREGRPIILNEPHVFYRNLKGAARDKAVQQGLAYKSWGEKPYLRTQNERYEWLERAIQIDEEAALKACSWGLSQILGENFSLVGYGSVQDMVRAFMRDEEEHVEAMMKYILATGIADDLRAERWDVVARVYNGPGYKKNRYHIKMAQEFAKLRGIADVDWAPDKPDPQHLTIDDEDTVRAVQTRLRELGYYEVGNVDGDYGTRTRAGVLAFRADHDLPIVADIDDELLAALMTGQPREVSEARANTTMADLRAKGSRQVSSGDMQQVTGTLLTGGGIAGGVAKATGIDPQGTFYEVWQGAQPYWRLIEENGIWLAGALGLFIIWQAHNGKQARLDDEREGKNVGRG